MWINWNETAEWIVFHSFVAPVRWIDSLKSPSVAVEITEANFQPFSFNKMSLMNPNWFSSQFQMILISVIWIDWILVLILSWFHLNFNWIWIFIWIEFEFLFELNLNSNLNLDLIGIFVWIEFEFEFYFYFNWIWIDLNQINDFNQFYHWIWTGLTQGNSLSVAVLGW